MHSSLSNRYCDNCQYLLPSSASYCSNCGSGLSGLQQLRSKRPLVHKEEKKHHEKNINSVEKNGTPPADMDDVTVRLPPLPKRQALEEILEKNGPLSGDMDDVTVRLPPLPKRKAFEEPVEGSSKIWPTLLLLSAGAAGFVGISSSEIVVRMPIELWFLLLCPGMAVVPLLHVKEAVVEWTLALALSLTIDAIVAGILLYAGHWSPPVTLAILIGFTIIGAVGQVVIPFYTKNINANNPR